MKLPIPKGKRAILVLGLPLGLAAAGAFVFMQMSAASSVPPKVPDPATGQMGPMLALDDRVINLNASSAGSYKYAKVGVSIEVRPSTSGFYDLHGDARTKSETTELEKYVDEKPRLLDALGSVVSAHDSATLITPEGRAKLKTELLDAFRKILGPDVILDVYFTNLVMQ
jgi:flagellar basal body-associated protein FliL